MFVVIWIAYWYIGRPWMNVDAIRSTAATLRLDNRGIFLAFAVYFTVVNVLIEEYIWRWFVCRQCEVFLPGLGAVGLAAFCFTLHHIVALQGYVGNSLITVLGALGVFIAGLIWSVFYVRYRSLLVCCISHMMADLAIAIVAGQILFGDI
ncbi:MAG: CPBP family intramembrane glutamic endopeptidase [Cyanobacteria bacterium P01_A01_bin.123]